MKTYVRLLVPTVLLAGYASAATISLTGISSSSNTASATSTITGATDNGTLSTLTAAPIPVMADIGIISTLNEGTYVVQIAGITVGGDTNLNLVFNLNVAASAGDGILIRKGNGRGWAVDDNQDGGSDARFLGTGESITFSISGTVVSGGSGSYDVAFNGFTGGVYVPDGGSVFTFAPGMTAQMTGTNGYARGLDFSFDITAVPEPSCLTLGAMGAALLLRRRRCC